MVGKLLGGRYQIVEILATGGFGQTYIAKDTHRPGSPDCVVKHLKPASINSSYLQNARRLFQSEAETLEKLGSHDQIPRLLAYFEENQEFYLVQDFIQGHPLSVELQPGKRWPESKVYRLLREVLEVLAFVHSHGVIHRDIKPNNIIQRQQDGKFVLVDFGSVKQAWTQVVTAPGNTNLTYAVNLPVTIGIGTPGYMPTEQVRGRPRPNSDLYALGIICLQALTGLHPTQLQEDPNTGEILWRHQTQVSEELASVLTTMVRYHFKDRYQTATEALQELQLLAITSSAKKAANGSSVQSLPQSDVLQHPALSRAEPAPVSETASKIQLSERNSSSPTAISAVKSQPNYPSSQNLTADNGDTVANPSDTVAHARVNTAAAQMSSTSLPLPTAASVSALQPTVHLPLKPQTPAASQQTVSATADVRESQNTATKHPASQISPSQHQLRVGAGITAALISLVATYTIYWQPRPESQEMEQIETLKTEENWTECVVQAAKIAPDSRLYRDAQSLLHECQLAQAQKLATERQFVAAMTEASKIPQDSNSWQVAEQLMNQSANSALSMARNEYQSGKLKEAIAVAEAIPETSSMHQQAETAIAQWQQDWQQNQARLQAAKTALAAQKWQEAISAAQQVADAPYWQKQVEPIVQTATAKSAAAKAASSKPAPTAPRQATATNRRQPTSTNSRHSTSSTATSTPNSYQRRTPTYKPHTTNQRRNSSAPAKDSYSWTTKTIP